MALFTGVDLVPVDSTLSCPNNANFVIQDINLGLDRYHDECNIIQAAFISRGVRALWQVSGRSQSSMGLRSGIYSY